MLVTYIYIYAWIQFENLWQPVPHFGETAQHVFPNNQSMQHVFLNFRCSAYVAALIHWLSGKLLTQAKWLVAQGQRKPKARHERTMLPSLAWQSFSHPPEDTHHTTTAATKLYGLSPHLHYIYIAVAAAQNAHIHTHARMHAHTRLFYSI